MINVLIAINLSKIQHPKFKIDNIHNIAYFVWPSEEIID